jgi:adenylate kinase family enzyme
VDRNEEPVKIIILRGNSGSGKTTLAKELQKKLSVIKSYNVWKK